VHLEVFKFFNKYLCNYILLEFSFNYSLFRIYINSIILTTSDSMVRSPTIVMTSPAPLHRLTVSYILRLYNEHNKLRYQHNIDNVTIILFNRVYNLPAGLVHFYHREPV